MSPPFLSLSLFLLFLLFPFSSPSFPFDKKYYIDCGSPTNTTDELDTTWISDRFYTGGASSVVSEPLRFRFPQEKTLRYFPLSSGKKNCYLIPLPSGRYYLRTFTVYDNYDGKSHSPSFEVSVEGILVFSWRSPWPGSLAQDGAYSDLFSSVLDGEADVCFYSIATDPPVIASLEIIQVDPNSYDSSASNSILVNYGRISCGSNQWGPGFTNDTDSFGRSWQSDTTFRTPNASVSINNVLTVKPIALTNQAPNYFPTKLFQTAVTSNGILEYELPVDAKMDYLLYFHFAEIDPSITRTRQRVFDIVVNDKTVNRVDIFAQVGALAAYSWSYTLQNLSSTTLSIKFVPSLGEPLVCAIENYAILPNDASTLPDQVVAMRALKESLRVPDRMGWNGDPCAPTNWDAWEGITCHPIQNGSSLAITQIDLGSQGLKGTISDHISLLTNLVSLNLSSNSLGGTLPSGLGQKSLLRLDLSNNQFSGSIPDSLTLSSLQLVLLNNNLLEGRVPEELYSIGMHGGSIDILDAMYDLFWPVSRPSLRRTFYRSPFFIIDDPSSGWKSNKGLCGVPSLPECSLLWENGRLSTGGKVAIGLSCLVILCVVLLLVYICCIRRGRNDYDFAPTHDLMSMAAKRNRYQRQKSLMLLEMESQHAKGLSSPYGAQ